MLRPQRHAVVIALVCVLTCALWLPPCAGRTQASELFGDAPGQPTQGESPAGGSEWAVSGVVDSLSLLGLGLGLALVPLAQPIAQAVSAAAGAGSHDQDHGLGHGQGHGQ
ncbi:hypothetical protein [Desulfocurvibacter africanus]|uniref:hypothetical protein n=1 Tax=Desulfocurvibacter africanus TaxID=873 RepID=UPI001269455E|nr:hypothetical protein [Desulfocurvibacter africanus]